MPTVGVVKSGVLVVEANTADDVGPHGVALDYVVDGIESE